MRDIWIWIRSLWVNSTWVLTSSGLVAVIAVVERVKGPLPMLRGQWLWAAAFVLFAVACYRSWHEEYEARCRLETHSPEMLAHQLETKVTQLEARLTAQAPRALTEKQRQTFSKIVSEYRSGLDRQPMVEIIHHVCGFRKF
jgi:hypothetical protein